MPYEIDHRADLSNNRPDPKQPSTEFAVHPKTFGDRFNSALTGWDNLKATSDDLLNICTRLKETYAGITWLDLTNQEDFHIHPSRSFFTPSAYSKFISKIEELGIGSERVSNTLPMLYETEMKSHFLIDVFKRVQNGSLESWFREAMSSNSPVLRANALFIIFNTDNPFLFINPEVRDFVDRLHDKYAQELGDLSQMAQDKMGYFFQELFFTNNYEGYHDWSYAQNVCQQTYDVLSDPELGPKIYRDFFQYVTHDRFLYPPHVFQWYIQMKLSYPELSSLSDLLKIFYQDHPEGIFNYFGRVNIIISALSRAGEHMPALKFSQDLYPFEDAGMLALFSGPPVVNAIEANLAGFSSVITVDSASLGELQPLSRGGKALILVSEIMPACESCINDPESFWPPNVRNKHHQVKIPQELSRLDEEIDFSTIRYITDNRGSLLYLDPTDQLDYLKWLMGKTGGEDDKVIVLSRGLATKITNHVILDFTDQKFDSEIISSSIPLFSNSIDDVTRISPWTASGDFLLEGFEKYSEYYLGDSWRKRADEIYIFIASFMKMVSNHSKDVHKLLFISSDYGLEEILDKRVDHQKLISCLTKLFDIYLYDGISLKAQLEGVDRTIWNDQENLLMDWFAVNDQYLLIYLLPTILGVGGIGITNLIQGILHPELARVPGK